MIVWLASYPRSGSTFFRLLIYMGWGLKTYSEYDDLVFDHMEGLARTIGHEKLPAPIEHLKRLRGVFLVKTHDLPTDDSLAIYLVRDGRDALVSYARYTQSFRRRTFWQRCKGAIGFDSYGSTLRELIAEGTRYGGWSENVLRWRGREATRITVRYEDLIDDPIKWVDEALRAVGCLKRGGYTGCPIPSFEELNERWPQFFRKGRAGGWQKEMSASLEELFWKHHGHAMEELGYEKALAEGSDHD